MKPVAFFDVDGTIFRSSLLIELVNKLVEEGIFPAEAINNYWPEQKAWIEREGSYEDYIEAVVTSFMTHIRGVHYGELADIGRSVVAVQSKRVYRYTRDLLSLKTSGFSRSVRLKATPCFNTITRIL